MKKLLPLLVILFVIVLSAAPVWVGFEAENRYRGMLVQLEEAGYPLTRHSYERGWFHSEARSVIRVPLDPAGSGQKNILVTLVSHILHGPYNPDQGWFGDMAMINTQLRLGDQPLFPETMQSDITTRIKFGGAGETRIDLPALQQAVALNEDLNLSFSGLNGVLEFTAGMDSLNIDISSDGLLVESSDKKTGHLQIGKMRIDSKSRRGVADLMLGKGSFNLAGFSLKDNTSGLNIDVKNINVKVETFATDDNFNMKAVYSVESIRVDEDLYGPVVLDVVLSNVAAYALVQMQEAVRMLQQVSPEQQPADAMESMNSLLASLPGVLASNPGFSIREFTVNTPDGKFELDFTLKADGIVAADFSNMDDVLGKLVGKASLRAPEILFRKVLSAQLRNQVEAALAQQGKQATAEAITAHVKNLVDRQLEVLLSQHFIERDGSDLVSAASLRSGLLSVNGKMLPLTVAGF